MLQIGRKTKPSVTDNMYKAPLGAEQLNNLETNSKPLSPKSPETLPELPEGVNVVPHGPLQLSRYGPRSTRYDILEILASFLGTSSCLLARNELRIFLL